MVPFPQAPLQAGRKSKHDNGGAHAGRPPAAALPAAPRPRRSDLPADANLCEYCTARCCKYFALPIDQPTEPKDFDFLRWYLLHGQASIFVENTEDWYLLVHTTCKHLLPNNLCGIYDTRPQICRDYSTANCEFEDDWTYDQYFETPEQMAEYVEVRFPPAEGESIRSPRPSLLPIVS